MYSACSVCSVARPLRHPCHWLTMVVLLQSLRVGAMKTTVVHNGRYNNMQGRVGTQALWLTLLDLASQVPHGTDNEFLDVLTSTAFALLRTIVAKSGEGDPSPEGTKVVLLVPTADQVELMCRITAQASTTAVAINMIGCLGCIGQVCNEECCWHLWWNNDGLLSK
eukprot:m.54467 g.54467  ORF g.54467 m.54467 type:complete len:166 (+) comp15510_c0_seq7:1781-2278(+)